MPRMNSFENFMWDLFIKSFENKESLIEASVGLSQADKMSIVYTNMGDLDIWQRIYDDRKDMLERNVSLVSEEQRIGISKIEFHHRFGWVVYGKEFKAYLGKSSIFRNVCIEIGHRTYFSGHSLLLGDGLFQIGKYCAIAENLYANVHSDFHPFKYASLYNFNKEVRLSEDKLSMPLTFNDDYSNAPNGINIGNDVWIGRNVRIFNGVKIGNGCVIGEGSLLRKDCKPYGVYVGTPAKLVKYRFKQSIIEKLLEIAWWNWPEEKILENKRFFDTDLTLFDGNVGSLIQT